MEESAHASQEANSVTPEDRREQIARLQHSLGSAAKLSRKRRFHALYDRIHRKDILEEAWRRVARNKGAAGIDGQSIDMIKAEGVPAFIEALHQELKEKRYKPQPVRGQPIPKANGGTRTLGIPTVRDRVVQMATKMMIEPIFEADFEPMSYGYRPGRSAKDAIAVVQNATHPPNLGEYVLDADIRAYFDTIHHRKLMKLVKKRISDRRVLTLIRRFLKAGFWEKGCIQARREGTPQGGVISPLLANIYLNHLDKWWMQHMAHLGTLVRYADDFVVICRRKDQVKQAEAKIRAFLTEELDLTLHSEKTRVVHLKKGKEGFDFLGCHFRWQASYRLWKMYSRVYYYMHVRPSKAAIKRLKAKVSAQCARSWLRHGGGISEIITRLNRVLKGWAAYFHETHAGPDFRSIDHYVTTRLHAVMCRWRGSRLKAGKAAAWNSAYFWGKGLYRLFGTTRWRLQKA